jgi:hypothetical protein
MRLNNLLFVGIIVTYKQTMTTNNLSLAAFTSTTQENYRPLESRAVIKTVFVDSRHRDTTKYPSTSDYFIDLPRTYHNVTTAHLVSSEIPSSFYVFRSLYGNTSLTLIVDSTPQTITIPDGNYGFSSIAAAIETALEEAFPGLAFSVGIDPITSKFSLTCDTDPTVSLGIDTTNAPQDKNSEWGLAYFLGFPKGVVTSGTGTVISPGMASLNPHTYILLRLGGGLNGTDHTGSRGGNSAFGKIPLPVNSYNFVFYDKVLNRQFLKPALAKLNRLHVSFTFHDGTPVDFHNMEHSFTLEFTCLDENSTVRKY